MSARWLVSRSEPRFNTSQARNNITSTVALAHERGLKIKEYRIFRGDKKVGGEKEEDVYRLMKMPLVLPEIREDRGEK